MASGRLADRPGGTASDVIAPDLVPGSARHLDAAMGVYRRSVTGATASLALAAAMSLWGTGASAQTVSDAIAATAWT